MTLFNIGISHYINTISAAGSMHACFNSQHAACILCSIDRSSTPRIHPFFGCQLLSTKVGDVGKMKILLMSHVGTIQKRLEPVHEAAGKVAMLAKSGMTAVNGLT